MNGLIVLYLCLPIIPIVVKISLDSIIYDRLRISHSKNWINKNKGKWLRNYYKLNFVQELSKTIFIYNFFTGTFVLFCCVIELIVIVLWGCKKIDTSFLSSEGFLYFIGITVTLMMAIHLFRQVLDRILK